MSEKLSQKLPVSRLTVVKLPVGRAQRADQMIDLVQVPPGGYLHRLGQSLDGLLHGVGRPFDALEDFRHAALEIVDRLVHVALQLFARVGHCGGQRLGRVAHLLRRLGQQLVVLLGHAAGVFEEVLRHLADGIGLPREFVVQRRKRLYVLRLLFHHAAQALGLVGIAQLRLRQTVEHALVAIQNFLTLLANLAHRPRRVAEGRECVGDVLNCLLLIAAGILQRDLQVIELAVHRVVHPADVRVGHVVHQL